MNLFITGASGYIGGSVALHLLKAGHGVRGLVRDTAKAEQLKQLGIVPVVGTLDDSELLIGEARASDGVINAANSDHRGAVEAFIEGLAGSGKPLVHTSGSSLVGDAVGGNRLSENIYDEDTPLVVGPGKQARYAIDTMVLQAPGMRGIVLCNSLIYGKGAGLQPDSVQVPPLVAEARKHGAVRLVGRGLNRWSTVHVEDVCELYALAVEEAPGGAFYFVENGESSFEEIGKAIARRLGIDAIERLTEEEATAIWGANRARYSLGSNSRVRAVRARKELGWRPRHQSVVDWIASDMDV